MRFGVVVNRFNVVRHFKGNWYLVICESTSTSDTGGDNVVYMSLYGARKIWNRPKEEFMSKTDKEKYPNAIQENRFMSINDLLNGGVTKEELLKLLKIELYPNLEKGEINFLSALI